MYGIHPIFIKYNIYIFLYIWGYTVRFHIKSTIFKVYTVGCIPTYTVHYLNVSIVRGVYRWVYTGTLKSVLYPVTKNNYVLLSDLWKCTKSGKITELINQASNQSTKQSTKQSSNHFAIGLGLHTIQNKVEVPEFPETILDKIQ